MVKEWAQQVKANQQAKFALEREVWGLIKKSTIQNDKKMFVLQIELPITAPKLKGNGPFDFGFGIGIGF